MPRRILAKQVSGYLENFRGNHKTFYPRDMLGSDKMPTLRTLLNYIERYQPEHLAEISLICIKRTHQYFPSAPLLAVFYEN